MATAQLGLIFLFAILGGVLAARFKQPTVLGLLLVGAAIGPHALGFVTDPKITNVAIDLGAILLLFTVGVEFNLKKLIGLGTKPIIMSIIKLGLVFFAGYNAALLLGFDNLPALYIGVILCITSTVIFIKVLEQKGYAQREELPLLIAVLIIEDIFAVFALTFFSSLENNTTPIMLITRLVFSLAVLIVVYLILQRLAVRCIQWLIKYSTEETFTFTSLGLCAGMSYLAYIMNLSPSVGAFLAGSIVASFPEAERFDKAIHPFILAFTSLFFLSIGTLINIESIIANWYIIFIFLLISILMKYGSVVFTTYLAGFSGRQAVFSGIAMISVGEFSLLIAKEGHNAAIDLVSVTAGIIIISSVCMAFSLGHREQLYKVTKHVIPKRVQEDLVFTVAYFKTIAAKLKENAGLVKHIAKDWKIIARNLSIIITATSVLFLVLVYSPKTLSAITANKIMLYGIGIVVLCCVVFFALSVRQTTKDMIFYIKQVWEKITANNDEKGKQIARAVIMTSSLLLLTVIASNAIAFLQRRPGYNSIPVILLILCILYGFHALSLIHGSYKEERKEFKEKLLKSKIF